MWARCHPDISTKKITPSTLQMIITKIINISLTQCTFVEEWKTAIVHPLLKKIGSELIPSNYRPVSNLSFLSKLLEKCALQQFNNHCDTNKLLPDYQSAYRKIIVWKQPWSNLSMISYANGETRSHSLKCIRSLYIFRYSHHEILSRGTRASIWINKLCTKLV